MFLFSYICGSLSVLMVDPTGDHGENVRLFVTTQVCIKYTIPQVGVEPATLGDDKHRLRKEKSISQEAGVYPACTICVYICNSVSRVQCFLCLWIFHFYCLFVFLWRLFNYHMIAFYTINFSPRMQPIMIYTTLWAIWSWIIGGKIITVKTPYIK